MRWKSVLLISTVIIAGLVLGAYIILSTYNYDRLKPEIAQAFRKATGRDLTLGGNIDLKIGFAPTLVVENVGIQNASWGSRPEMAVIKRFEIRVALLPLIFGRVDVERLILIDPDILIETSRSGQSNLDFFQKIASANTKKEAQPKGKVELTLNELRIEKGRITYRNEKSARTHMIGVNSLAASAAGAQSPVHLKLKGSYNEEPFEVAGTFAPLESVTSSGRPWPLNLTLGVPGATLSLDGTIKDVPGLQGIDMKFAVKIEDLKKISRLLGHSLPLRGRLEISGRLNDPKPKIYGISDLKATCNDSDLGGSLQLNFSGNRPVLTANLLSKRVDLRSPLQKGTQKAGTSESGRERIFPDQPLPIDALQQADAAVTFRAAAVLLPRAALQNLKVDMTLKDGRLSVEPLTAVIGGGTLDGRFNLQTQGKFAEMEMVMKIDRVDVAAMLKELNITNVLHGRIDANIDVKARGSSIAGMMAGLNGKTFLVMGNGQITNEHIGLLGSDLSSSIFRLINPLHKESADTKVSCIVCGFDIKNGLAQTTALVVNTSYMSVIGDGKVDLKTEKLDLGLKPIPKEGIGTSLTGKLSVSLGELARPFKLAGTLAHPSLALDLTRTGITLGKAVGGFLLFGPVGIVGALTGESTDDKNLCPLAVKAAEEGVKLSALEKKKEGVVGKTTQGIEKNIGEVGKQIKKLFGK